MNDPADSSMAKILALVDELNGRLADPTTRRLFYQLGIFTRLETGYQERAKAAGVTREQYAIRWLAGNVSQQATWLKALAAGCSELAEFVFSAAADRAQRQAVEDILGRMKPEAEA